MIYRPASAKTIFQWAGANATHPVLGSMPGYYPSSAWTDPETEFPAIRIVDPAPHPSYLVPPSVVVAWHFAREIRIQASADFRGASFSMDEVFAIRSPRAGSDEPSDYASPDSMRERLAAPRGSLVALWTPPGETDAVVSPEIYGSDSRGEAGEDGSESWNWSFDLQHFGSESLVEAGADHPASWVIGFDGRGSTNFFELGMSVTEENPDYEEPPDPETITYSAACTAVAFDYPDAGFGGVMWCGIPVASDSTADSSFEMEVSVESWLPR